MTDVNSGYPAVQLGELLAPVSRPERVVPTTIYPLLGARWYAKGLYVKETKPGSQIQATTVYKVREGDFVYNRLFAWKGSFAVATSENDGCYVSNEFPCFAVDQSQLDSRYLKLYFQREATWNEAFGLSTGGTPTSRNRLKVDKLLAMTIPLPPLAEQWRLVTRIEALAAKISGARRLRNEAIAEADALVESHGRTLIDSVAAEPTELRSWIVEDGIQTGPFGAQLGSDDFLEFGVPVLTIGNVQFGGLRLDKLKYVTEAKAAQLHRYTVRPGDILFARMGTVGRCCVVPLEAEGWLINYHIIRVALDQERVDPRFIHWRIQASAEVEGFLDSNIRGATREGVNSHIVGSLPCRVPSLEEQRRIVAKLDDLQAKADILRRLQDETQEELNVLLPAVLDRAFRGAL